MKYRLFSLLMGGLLLLLAACTQSYQEGVEISPPTIINEGEEVVVVPTAVNPTSAATTESSAPRPEVTVTPEATATTQPAATATTQPAATATVQATAAACQPRTDWESYTIQAGDTLFSIAQAVGSTVDALAQANCLTNVNALETGETLYLPSLPETTEDNRIRFPANEFEAAVTGQLAAGEADDYIFGARAGQLLLIGFAEPYGARAYVTSPNGEVVVNGIGQFGTYLLPASGDYQLRVTAATAASYQLSVSILPAPVAGSPERVQFASGAVSARLTGTTAAGEVKRFVVAAGEDQLLSLEFNGATKIAVRGADGQRLFEFDDAQPVSSYSNIYLPKTQDYVISILPFSGGALGDPKAYDLTMTIVDAADESAEAERITLASGTIATTVTGTGSETGSKYVLKASEGQRLMVAFMPITDQNGQRVVYVVGEDGQLLLDGIMNAAVIVPKTQDYYLTVRDIPGHDYRLMIAIDPNNVLGNTERIEFASGATSAELSGNLTIGETKRFVVRAAAGQQFAFESQNSAGARFVPVVLTPNGREFIPYNLNNMVVSELLTLPETGDYTIFLLALESDGGTAEVTYNYKLTIVTP